MTGHRRCPSLAFPPRVHWVLVGIFDRRHKHARGLSRGRRRRMRWIVYLSPSLSLCVCVAAALILQSAMTAPIVWRCRWRLVASIIVFAALLPSRDSPDCTRSSRAPSRKLMHACSASSSSAYSSIFVIMEHQRSVAKRLYVGVRNTPFGEFGRHRQKGVDYHPGTFREYSCNGYHGVK